MPSLNEMTNDEYTAFNLEANVKFLAKGDQYSEVLKKQLQKHPPGSLGLPPLLDKRRVEAGIPAEVFQRHAGFDWVLIWPIAQNAEETYEGTGILRPAIDISRDRQQAPRGVIVSAGPAALDRMRDHGYEVGDIVNFVLPTAFKLVVGHLSGFEIAVYPMRVHYLVCSEDAMDRVRSGEQWIEEEWEEDSNGNRRRAHIVKRKGQDNG